MFGITLLLTIPCLSCASPQLAGNVDDRDMSVEVAMITLGSYRIADQLKAASSDYRLPP
jgi:hypothetical protein